MLSTEAIVGEEVVVLKGLGRARHVFWVRVKFSCPVRVRVRQVSLIPKMSKREVLDDLRNMPYFKNYAATSGAVHNISKHEDAVKDIFIKHGLREHSKTQKHTLPPMSFVSQPNGTQKGPDFLVRFGCHVVYNFECKSTDNNSTPLYNSGGIKQDFIYVYSAAKYNKTTLYIGGDVCSLEQQRLIDELVQRQNELAKEYNSRIKEADVTRRGVYYYTRPMISQRGGAELTDYFTHPDRKRCELRVYDFMNAEPPEEPEPQPQS